MAYSPLYEISSSTAKEVCKDEKTQKFISGAASTLIGAAASSINPALGVVVKAAASGLSRSHSKEVAEAATTAVVAVGVDLATMVAAPFIVIGFIWSSIFDD